MANRYADLGAYSDLVTAAHKSAKLYPLAKPGKATQKAALATLAFDPWPAKPRNIKVERTWTRDGVDGELVTYSVGYGPRTEAWYLRPAGVKGKLPGVIALHDHGGFKYWGKEKVALGPDDPHPLQLAWHQRAYGGRGFANVLAKLGFAVLVPDIFTWGSRKFDFNDIPAWDRSTGDIRHQVEPMEPWPGVSMPPDISRYSWACVYHEHTVQKYCHVLGTTFAGVIAFEDRVAAAYLDSRSDVQKGGLGCVGLSGGGLRSTLMQATCPLIRAAVVVGLMSTYPGLLDHNVVSHTWMMYPDPAWARIGDWPDLLSCRAPSPLMVQYDKEDALFTMQGMTGAHKRIARHYRSVGKPGNYVGKFYEGPHKFDAPMQDDAFAWFEKQLKK